MLAVKVIHTILFFILNWCVFYILYSGIVNRITGWTKLAIILMVLEGIILIFNNWRCPLRDIAERLGAKDGRVSSLFLPRWLAKNLFEIYTPLFLISCAILIIRRLRVLY